MKSTDNPARVSGYARLRLRAWILQSCSRRLQEAGGGEEGEEATTASRGSGRGTPLGRKARKGKLRSFRGGQPRSPTHKVDKKEKDRAAMRP